MLSLTESEKNQPICFSCFEKLGLEKYGFIAKEARWRASCGFCEQQKTVFSVREASNLS